MEKTVNRLMSLTIYICNVLLFSSFDLQAMENSRETFTVPSFEDGYLRKVLPYNENNFLVFGCKTYFYNKDYSARLPFLAQWNIQEQKQVSFNHDLDWVDDAFKLDGPYVKLVYYARTSSSEGSYDNYISYYPGKFQIFNVETGKIECTIQLEKAHQAPTKESLSLKGDRIALFFNDDVVHILDKAGKIEKEITLHPDQLYKTASDGDNRILQLSFDQGYLKLFIFELEKNFRFDQPNLIIPTFSEPESNFSKMCMHLIDNNHFALALPNGSIQIWNLEKKEIELEFQAHDCHLSSIITINDERIATRGLLDGIVKIWSWKNKELISQFEGPKGPECSNVYMSILSVIGNHIAYGNLNAITISQYN